MRNRTARETALLGMLFALAMALSFLESSISPLLGLMPAMKLGLSNIVVMYALVMLGRRPACLLILLKAAFAFFVRGATAGFLSACGGCVSFAVFCGLLALPFPVTGLIFSVCGAVGHNLGQLLGAALLLSSSLALGYAPVLLAVGVLVGAATAAVSHAVFPMLYRIAPEGRKHPSKIIF